MTTRDAYFVCLLNLRQYLADALACSQKMASAIDVDDGSAAECAEHLTISLEWVRDAISEWETH